MARNAEVRPQPGRTPTKVLGAFDPRQFGPVAVHALFPDAGRHDFSDDRTDSAADDGTESSSLGVAHDLIGCVLAGKDNTSECNHSGVDHIDMAGRCLANYSRDEAGRAKRRSDAGQHARVRFA